MNGCTTGLLLSYQIPDLRLYIQNILPVYRRTIILILCKVLISIHIHCLLVTCVAASCCQCKLFAVLVDLFCQAKIATTSTSNDMHKGNK